MLLGFMPTLLPVTDQALDHWVRAALAEAAALREYNQKLYTTSEDEAAMAAAEQLHELWKKWEEQATQLLERHLKPALARGVRVDGSDDLRTQIARARNILKVSPREMRDRWRRIQAGEKTYSAEEVRRELGLPPRR